MSWWKARRYVYIYININGQSDMTKSQINTWFVECLSAIISGFPMAWYPELASIYRWIFLEINHQVIGLRPFMEPSFLWVVHPHRNFPGPNSCGVYKCIACWSIGWSDEAERYSLTMQLTSIKRLDDIIQYRYSICTGINRSMSYRWINICKN